MATTLAVNDAPLYHVSEESGIDRFTPRAPGGVGEPVVWAIDAAHLRNYLVPRDCPRVTFAAGPNTTEGDRQRFLGASRAVVAIEAAWYSRLERCSLTCYEFGRENFACVDPGAGYYVSRQDVVPRGVRVIHDLIDELRARGVELRVLPSLWALHDEVAASSLEFSIIRMRNAAPRD